jgi:hypothetical protein
MTYYFDENFVLLDEKQARRTALAALSGYLETHDQTRLDEVVAAIDYLRPDLLAWVRKEQGSHDH